MEKRENARRGRREGTEGEKQKVKVKREKTEGG